MLARKALAGTAAAPKVYVEDVFSTYLYTGNGSTQTITNNIDLSGEGGLVWTKVRSEAGSNILIDSARGVNKYLYSQNTDAQATSAAGTDITSFNSNGYSLGTPYNEMNDNGKTFVSWTFRKAEKFFDVVTYTGNGTARTIAHNLGSTPGFIVVKCTSAGSTDWAAYHRSLGATKAVILNGTDVAFTISSYWNDTEPTSSVFSVGTFGNVNTNGATYVAYLFAHDAGGFGDAGDQSVISCGSVTATGGNVEVNLGWEPQWVLVKNASVSENWRLLDNMRGITNAGTKWLFPNTSGAETDNSGWNELTATGFKLLGWGSSGNNYIYIAIRRGPMKTPEAGTEVYNAITRTGSGADVALTTVGFPVDWVISGDRTAGFTGYNAGRLTGANRSLLTTSTGAESTDATRFTAFDSMNGFSLGSSSAVNNASRNYAYWNFRRAPGFFDVVCYTGTGSSTTVSHNLGVAPELLIVKSRSNAQAWSVLTTLNSGLQGRLNETSAFSSPSSAVWGSGGSYVAPTSTVFTVGTDNETNGSGYTYVAYLFASVSGVSKVGSYTGNGSSVTVTTGFQPRFILVKRTDSTGNWIVSDSARGLIAGNDPYLLLNSTAAEDTDEDWVDVSSTGFTVNETSASNANTNTGTYIYLAIA